MQRIDPQTTKILGLAFQGRFLRCRGKTVGKTVPQSGFTEVVSIRGSAACPRSSENQLRLNGAHPRLSGPSRLVLAPAGAVECRINTRNWDVVRAIGNGNVCVHLIKIIPQNSKVSSLGRSEFQGTANLIKTTAGSPARVRAR